ncbi:hypothetical protein KY290_013923 [Solanum tuberosum]|uniref:Retrotransposon Copia-like N-terminal domain-containing protein n=1 Tax=Solanum tuberosum TaxID=4113 RepID=A0ABQ7VN63_SOLTU|nr:hypothetical protein KY290_013923 [Solanum tuberosum]
MESAGSTLMPSIFDGTGYRSWRRSILRGISVKNKMGFITGKCVKPPSTDPTCNLWEGCDDMVILWILNSLSTDIADSLQYVNNANELWQELEDRYDQPNGAKHYQIQREINDLTQGVLDITGYYTKLKKLWEELNALDASALCNCVCMCGAKANSHKAEHDKQLIQFLMGLNEVYTVVKWSILMMNPLPTIAQGFSILIQEEKQREVRPPNQSISESTSLNAGVQNADFKFTKGRNVGTIAHVHGTGSELEDNHQNQGKHLTKDHYNQLMQLLDNFQVGTVAEVSHNDVGAANFTDSGASNHMSSDRKLLTNTRHLPYPFLITLPNGYKALSMKRPLELGKARNDWDMSHL